MTIAHLASTALLACAGLPSPTAHAQAPTAGTAADVAAQWRGTVVPPYLSGMRELGGACIGPERGGESMCSVMVSVLRDEQSGIHTLFATRPLRHADGMPVGDARKPLELVTDVIEVPALDDGGNEVSLGLCEHNGREDRRIVAVVHPDPGIEWYTRLHGVWRVDDDGRFRPIPADGVRCMNEGYGYDG